MIQRRMVLLILLVLVAGCSQKQESPPQDEIVVQLKWEHGVQFAGMYAAQVQGFYAEENLAVTFEPGGVGVVLEDRLFDGTADFVVMGATEALVGRANGQPHKAIAVINQVSPLVYFAKADAGITSPHDFAGRRVLVYPDDNVLPIMLARNGVDPDTLVVVEPQDFALADFYEDRVEIVTGYLTNEVLIAQRAGYDLAIVYPDDFGVHVYSDCLVTTDELIAHDPDLVARFLRATLRGWRYAIENPDTAADLALDHNSALDPEREHEAMRIIVALVYTGQSEIGWMQAEKWQSMYDMLPALGLIETATSLQDAYTMDFLQQVYE